uniref:Putative secreted protein n=1 Tax=Anopheles darlingi TaxID=43151 RepID=A0A2M4D3Z2_ANODA
MLLLLLVVLLAAVDADEAVATDPKLNVAAAGAVGVPAGAAGTAGAAGDLKALNVLPAPKEGTEEGLAMVLDVATDAAGLEAAPKLKIGAAAVVFSVPDAVVLVVVAALPAPNCTTGEAAFAKAPPNVVPPKPPAAAAAVGAVGAGENEMKFVDGLVTVELDAVLLLAGCFNGVPNVNGAAGADGNAAAAPPSGALNVAEVNVVLFAVSVVFDTVVAAAPELVVAAGIPNVKATAGAEAAAGAALFGFSAAVPLVSLISG